MSALDQIGLDDTTQSTSTESHSKRDGGATLVIFEGPLVRAEQLFNAKKQDRLVDDVTIQRRGGIGIVSVSSGEDNSTAVLQDSTWELIGERLVKDLRTHQNFNQDADQDNIELARSAVEEAQTNFTPVAGAATDYYALRVRGVQEYLRSQPVLRQSIRTTRRSRVTASWLGVDRAHTLQGKYGPRPPTELIGAINNMPEADSNKRQWLKLAPQVAQIDRKLWSVSSEWIFARRWSNILYEGDNETDNP